MSPKTWLITGCSSGFGHHLTKTALAHNDTVIATSRDPSNLRALTPTSNPNCESKASEGRGKLIPKKLDLSGPDHEIESFVKDILSSVGKVDVLVNNAGFVFEGGIEEATTNEITTYFRTNLTSHLTLTRALIPSMRTNHSGLIATMGSIAGWGGVPGTGIYCASKAAMAMCTEALREELAGTGIEVTCLEPGHFRTELLSEERVVRAERKGEGLEWLRELDGQQPGDVRKGAQVVYEVLMGRGRYGGRGQLPGRLPVGGNAVEIIGGVLERQRGVLREWGMGGECDVE
ncbi:3-oxoacyl-reductase [Aspergillus sclerotioniger CBS 115572]|uniref:3-oxoacyl-reductase n=1 Tax=Aspergillus sclerotioniger CBS 115572 TaxID=1450535 RepID=A0A317W8P1_9EURO|nr:3-oxoacyl-reductase [Aspergillus sclerotioniger CBS 115572]PWY81667.1 3-oxoacyl-reductase [Aspergillus sclerotioniger CBS 115572]